MLRRLRREDGFGLIELTIAMTMLAIGIAALGGLFVSGHFALRRASQSDTAAVLVSKLLERFRAETWDTVGVSKALFDSTHAERLRGTGRAGTAVAELADFFLEFHRQRYRFDGAPIHDAMAVAHVIDPTLVETLECNISIETGSEFCDGRTVVDLRGVTGREPNADVGVDVDAERFLELLVTRIASLP